MDIFSLGKIFLRTKKEVAYAAFFYFPKPLAFVFFLEYNRYRKREKCHDIRKGVRRNWKIFKEN